MFTPGPVNIRRPAARRFLFRLYRLLHNSDNLTSETPQVHSFTQRLARHHSCDSCSFMARMDLSHYLISYI